MNIPTNIFTIIIIAVLVILQGTFIFKDALKNRIPYPYLWGVIGLLNIPSSLIFYLIFKKWYFIKKRRNDK